jgi:oxidase EvaA
VRILEDGLIESLLVSEGPAGSVQDICSWIEARRQAVVVRVDPIPLNEIACWAFDPGTRNLRHESGKFFSIEGVRVLVDDGKRREWTQPIINQPEIGILGVLAKEFDGVLCFLMQAKIEPGNVRSVQISPTLQATRSNYSQVHSGRRPLFLDYFREANRSKIVLDQVQSEQGARFLRKRNRNIVLKLEEDIPSHEDFRWMTLGQIKQLMRRDNVVNMDTRTVFSGLRYVGSFDLPERRAQALLDYADRLDRFGQDLLASEMAMSGYNTIDHILFWLSRLKSTYELQVDRIPLSEVEDWKITDNEIVRPDRRFFRVLGVQVTIESREVKSWCQPIVEPMQEGLCAFIVRKIQGVYHFLVQAKIECGNFDVVEMAPTVQCLTGDYRDPRVAKPPFFDYVLNARGRQVLFDTLQSEEGGRFYHEQNRNLVVEGDSSLPERLPENFNWLTLGQVKEFLRYNNYLNIQARSLIATLDYRQSHGQ